MVPKTSEFTTAWRLPWNSKKMPLTMKYSNQQSEKQCRASSFPKTTQNRIAKPYLCLTQILCQLVDKSFVNWLTSWANQRELQSRSSGILNWNRFAGVFGLSTIKTIKAIKENHSNTTPTTHWECHCMIARTHHAAF